MFSANTSQVSDDKLFVEDVFSTFIYSSSSYPTINNGIDLANKGGMVWFKRRNTSSSSVIFDTNRGPEIALYANAQTANSSFPNSLTAFNSNGFNIGSGLATAGELWTSWTFRKAPKFFDAISYTGNGSGSRNVSHSLGTTPGCIIIKASSGSSNWYVQHTSLASNEYLNLNLTTNKGTAGSLWDASLNTSTTFNLGANPETNSNGGTYVAYLFANDTTSDGIIRCGSYTGNGITPGPQVSLGWEPQFVMIKNATATGNWLMFDAIRGMPIGSVDPVLYANGTVAETITTDYLRATETGFQIDNNSTVTDINTNGSTYIYIAIRCGLMRTPTSGATVFQPITYTGTNVDNRLVNTGIVTDMAMARIKDAASAGSFYVADRMRGNLSLATALTAAENSDVDSFMTPNANYGTTFASMVGFGVGNDATRLLNGSSTNQLAYAFRRAKGFFDQVCYSGNSVAGRAVNHNLGVKPEAILIKSRSDANANFRFFFQNLGGADKYSGLALDSTSGSLVGGLYAYNGGIPTASQFFLDNISATNSSGSTYVAYLFASCPGVSKIGSYTGNGSSQTINCGFAAGARFILIKRTDSAGDWYVWDTARGIVAGNDPYLALNTTSGEVTIYDSIDTDSSGFVVNQDAGTNINVSSATYIYLAVA